MLQSVVKDLVDRPSKEMVRKGQTGRGERDFDDVTIILTGVCVTGGTEPQDFRWPKAVGGDKKIEEEKEADAHAEDDTEEMPKEDETEREIEVNAATEEMDITAEALEIDTKPAPQGQQGAVRENGQCLRARQTRR
jgi:hypothetical protein